MRVEQDQLEQDKRSATHRSRVMLAATLLVRGVAMNVRIRNISETGALLEGDVLPEVGSTLLLRRGRHEVGAEVMWAQAGRCGVRFEGTIVVADWAGVQAAAAQAGAAGAAPPPLPSSLMPQAEAEDGCEALMPRRVAEELAYVQRLIENIGNELVSNPLIVHRHGRTFQDFDVASQILGHLARVLTADDRVGAAEKVGMVELRKRLLRC
jgi:hypothetical protein